jgi:PucR family transcriptional regulator, purine catabolism regulatory protein
LSEAETGAMVAALQAQNAALRQLVSIHDRLGALVLQGADVGAVTRMLSDLVGRRVLLLDALLQVIAMAPAGDQFEWAPRQGYVRAVLATLARERRPLRVPPMTDFGVDASCVLAPVALGDAILGYLALLPESDERIGPGDDVDLQIVQHAANVYALSMMRERMAAEVARQLKDELFEGLLSGRPQDETVARERAIRLGYSPDLIYRVLVIVLQSPADQAVEDAPEVLAQRRRLLESLSELAARRSVDAFATLRDDELVVLMPDADDARDLAHHAVRHSAALGPDWRITVALGGPASTASAISASYAQARRALEVAQRFYPAGYGDIVAFEDLGLYRLLFHVSDPAELRGFTEQVLGALLEYDQRHNADFVRTLAAFLSNNGNLQATARELNLHVNSVGYRLQRIQAIAGLDLERSEDRLLAQVALKILSGIAA